MSPTSQLRGNLPFSLAAELELASEAERMSPFHTQLSACRGPDVPGSPVTPASSASSSPNTTTEPITKSNPEKKEQVTEDSNPTTAPFTIPTIDASALVDNTEWKYEDDIPRSKPKAGGSGRTASRKTSFSSVLGRRFSGFRAEFSRRQDSCDSFMSEPVSYGETNYMSQDLWITQKTLGMISGDRPTSGTRVRGPGGVMGGGYTGNRVRYGDAGGSFSNMNEIGSGRTRAAWRRRRRVERGNIDDCGRVKPRTSVDVPARLKTMIRGSGAGHGYGNRRGETGTVDQNGITVNEESADNSNVRSSSRRRKRGRDYVFEAKERVWGAAARRKVRDRIKRWWTARTTKREFLA